MKKQPIYNISHFTQRIRKSELYVNTFKEHLQTHSFIEKPHRHNFYLLGLFTNGSGFHEIDFDRYAVKPGSLFMIQPGQIHHWQLSEDIEGYIVFCGREIYNAYFENKKIEDYTFYRSVTSKPELKLNNSMQLVLPYFKMMVDEYSSPELKTNDKILNLLDTLFIEIDRQYQPESKHDTHPYNHKINELQMLLEKYFMTQKSPSFYASKMNMTLKHLNRICKNILDQTVTDIVAKRVILEAKRLLTDQTKSVAQIADLLGYDNYPYFGKVFKKYTQMSPGEFRKSIA